MKTARTLSVKSLFHGIAFIGVCLVASLVLTTCDMFKVGLGNKVDINPPEIAFTSPAQNADVNAANFSLSGTVSDDTGAASVTVSWSGGSTNATISGSAWSAAVGSLVDDGRQVFTATATDQAGKSVSASITLNVDRKAPTVLVTAPQGYGAEKPSQTSYIDIKGEVYDASTIEKVEVEISGPGLAGSVAKTAEGTNSWSVRFLFGAGGDIASLTDAGIYTYNVIATDVAGNENTYYYHSSDIYDVLLSDETFPAMTDIGRLDQDKDTTASVGSLTYAALSAHCLGSATSAYGDFIYDASGLKPVIHLTNLNVSNLVDDNIISANAPVTGYVSAGTQGLAVDADSIAATVKVYNSADAPAPIPSRWMSTTAISSSVSFSIDLRTVDSAGASWLANGRYELALSACSESSTDAAISTVGFIIDSSAPQFAQVVPEVTEPSFIAFEPLTFAAAPASRQGVLVKVKLTDDNDGVALGSVAATTGVEPATTAIAASCIETAAIPDDGTDESGDGWFAIKVEVPSGVTDINLAVYAEDTTGRTAQVSPHYIVDTIKPTVAISSPASGAWLTGMATTLSGTASDDDRVMEVRYWTGKDGTTPPADPTTWTVADGTSSWSAVTNYADGEGAYELRAVAIDRAGNLSEVAIRDFGIDLASPTATMAASSTAKGFAESGTEYREAAFVLSGDCDDDASTTGRRPASATLTVAKDGGAASALSFTTGGATTGSWAYDRSVNTATHADDGLYVYTLTVTDGAGKASVATKTVRIDTTAPTLSVIAPASGESTLQDTYTFQGIASDLGSGVNTSALAYTLDGGPSTALTLTGTTWQSATVTFATEGTKALVVSCADKLGNASSPVTVTFYYDLNKPELSETTIGSTTLTTNGYFSLGGKTKDTNQLASVDILATRDGTPAATWSKNWSIPETASNTEVDWDLSVDYAADLDSTDGTYTFTVTAKDVAGKTETLQRTAIIDRTAPTADLDADVIAKLGGWQLSQSVSLSGGADDGTGSGVARVEYLINGAGSWTSFLGTTVWYGLATIPAGATNTLEVRAVDYAGNTSDASSYTVKVDDADPTIAIVLPAEYAAGTSGSTNANIDFSGTIGDTIALDGTTPLAITLTKGGSTTSGTPAFPTSATWSYTFPADAAGHTKDGSWTVIFTAKDQAGRTTSLQRSIVVDTLAPTATFSNLAAEQVISDASPSVSGSFSDATGVDKWDYQLEKGTWDGSAWSYAPVRAWAASGSETDYPTNETNPSWDISLPSLDSEQGRYRLTLKAWDVVGNAPLVSAAKEFYIDRAAPALSVTAPADKSYSLSGDLTVSGTAGDASGIKSVTLSVNGATISASSTSGNFATWQAVIPAANIVEGSNTISVEVQDKVSKPTTGILQIVRDTVLPELAFTSHADDAVCNETITLRGTAYDATSGLKSVSLATSIGGGSFTVTLLNGQWSAPINTATYGNPTYGTEISLGVWEVTLVATVEDQAGHTFQDSIVLRFSQEADRPVVTTTNITEAGPNPLGQNPSVTFNVEDDDAVDADEIQYRLDEGAGGDSGWLDIGPVLTSDSALVMAKTTLNGITQGDHTIKFRAMDTGAGADWAAGDLGTAPKSFKWVETPNYTISIDYGPPAVSITSPIAGTVHKADIVVEGSASDYSGVDPVFDADVEYEVRLIRISDQVEVRNYTTTTGTPVVVTPSGDHRDATFAVTISMTLPSALAVGDYTLQVLVTDGSGTTQTVDRSIVVDTEAPKIDSILQPSDAETGVNGSDVVVKGEASDNRQVEAVFVWHGLVSDPDPNLPVRTGAGSYTTHDGGLTPEDDYVLASGTTLWSLDIDTTAHGTAAAEDYRIRVVAFDTIGNRCDPSERVVSVDQSADRPEISFSNLTVGALDNRLGSGGRIIGVASDDDGIYLASGFDGIQIMIDADGNGDFSGCSWVPMTSMPTSNSLVATWYHDVSALSQGKKNVKVRALDIKDNAGNAAKFSSYDDSLTANYNWAVSDVVDFYIDYGPPTMTIAGPTSSQRFNYNDIAVTGTTSDSTGVQKVTIWVDADADGVIDKTGGEWTDDGDGIVETGEWTDSNFDGVVDSGELTVIVGGATEATPLTTDATTYNISRTIENIPDGTIPIQIKAYDLSYAETVRDLSIVVDTNKPTAAIENPAQGAEVNGIVKFNGTADDAGGIVSAVEYSIERTDSDNQTVNYAGEVNWTVIAGQTGTWTLNLDTTGFSDTYSYYLKVRAKDWANNYTATAGIPIRTITVKQSTDRPKIQVTSIVEGGTAIQNLLPTDRVITGTIQDDDAVNVESIQVQIYQSDGSTIQTAWTHADVTHSAVNATFVVWSYTVPSGLPSGLADGIYKIKVRAYDTNSSNYTTGYGWDDRYQVFVEDNGGVPDANDDYSAFFAIDGSNPTIEATAPAQNYFTNGGTGNTIALSGTAYDGSGLLSVQIQYKLQTDTDWTPLTRGGTLESWTASIDTTSLADGVYGWQAVATDNFKKTNTVDRIFTLDKTKPVVTVSNPAESANPAEPTKINGSLYIDGSATDKWKTTQDGFQIASVRVWIGAGTDPDAPAITSYYLSSDAVNTTHDLTHWKELSGTNSWNYRFNTTKPTVLSGDYTIYVAAIDNSDNVSIYSTRHIDIDQSENLPTVSLTTLSAGYYGGTLDSATVTTLTDNALDDSDVEAGWYVRLVATGELRKVTAFDDGTDTVTFAPPLAAVPAGGYDLFPNILTYPSSAEGEISDDDGVDPASIKIAVDANGDGVISETGDEAYVAVDSTTTSGGKIIFSHSIGDRYLQGTKVYRLKVQASDVGDTENQVDAVTTTTAEYVFVRDDAAPSSATLSSFNNGVETKTTGITGSNFNDKITLTGGASDGVQVGLVEVAIGAAADFVSGTPRDFAAAADTSGAGTWAAWSFSDLTLASELYEGEIEVRVRVTDIFGKQTTESFTFNVDLTGPEVAFTSPTTDALINGSLYMSGTADDDYSVSTVYVWYDDAAPGSLPTASAANGWNLANNTAAWNYRYDSSARSNGAKTLRVVAIDNAGNVGTPETLAVTFDQGLNRPSVRVNSLYANERYGTAGVSTTTSMTDSSLIGKTEIEAGWVVTFPDATTKTLSAFNSTTGQLSWTGALASAFPVGSSFTLDPPTYAVDSYDGATITDDALSGASVAAGWAVVFQSGETRLVTGFAGTTITLTDLPSGIDNGWTFRVVRKTFLGSGASISGTISDDDGVNTSSVKVALDLDNDGDYADDGGFLPVSSVTGSGTSVSFTHDLTSLGEGTIVYKLWIQAADVGEPAYGVAAVTTTTKEYLVAKDDGEPGDAVLSSFGNGYLSKMTDIANSYIKNYIVLGGTATDGVGVASVQINVNGLGYQNATTFTAPNWTYSRSGLSLTSGANVPVLVLTTDYWGRQTVTSFSFKADADAPTLNVTAFGRKLNGTETLQGTASDTYSSVDKVYLWQGTGEVPAFNLATYAADGWSNTGVTETTNPWSYSLVTTDIHNLATDQTYNIGYAAVDVAGNFATSTSAETINQDSDRPVISFSNIGMTSAGTVNRFDANPKLIGTVQDDDGVDKTKVLVSLDGAAYVLVTNPPAANGTAGGIVSFSHELTDVTGTLSGTPTTTSFIDAALIGKTQIVAGSWEAVLTVAGASVTRPIATFDAATGAVTWTDATAEAPSGSYTLRLEEGTHTISLRVGDTKSPAYVEGSFARLGTFMWEQSDGDATADWQNDPSDFTYDTGSPEIGFTMLSMGDRYSGAYSPPTIISEDDEDAMAAITLYNDWTLAGTAVDGSLKSISVQVDSYPAVSLAVASTWSHTFTWLSSPPSGFTQGNHTIRVTATDDFAKVTVKTLSVIFDSAEPVLTVSAPVDANSDLTFDSSVNGTVYMNGTLNEASTVTIDVGLDGRADYLATYTTPSAVANWTYNFNSNLMRNWTYSKIQGDTDDDEVKDVGETWTGDDGSGGGTANDGIENGTEIFVYVSNVRITAKDSAGNVTRKLYTVVIDNSTDRPTTSITLPSTDSYRSGDVLVSGLCSDDAQADDGVYSVWVQIDANGDGDFGDHLEFSGTGTNAGADNDPYENETLWYRVPAAQLINGAAWTLTVNGSGTLYSAPSPVYSPTITNVTVTAGQLYSSFSGFSGMIKIRAAAVDNHGVVGTPSTAITVFMDESYPTISESAIFVNGEARTLGVATMVNGTVKLTALFEDDQKISAANLQIKYNQASFAAIGASSLAGPADWDGDGYDDTYALKKTDSTVYSGDAEATTATSLTASGLGGLGTSSGTYVLYTAHGARMLTTDGTTTVTWTGALTGVSADEPYIIAMPFELDTQATIGGVDYADGEGELSIVLRSTDETNQSYQTTILLGVDNKRPTGVFNYNDSLTYVGTDKETGLYAFSGSGQSNNLLIGSMVDTGVISGISKATLYFVKDTDGDDVCDATDKFYSPVASWTATTAYLAGAYRRNGDNVYVVADAGTSGASGPSGTGTGITDGSVTWDFVADVSAGEVVGSLAALYATGASSTTNVPYTTSGAYAITVDKRTENLVYDGDGGTFGDGDGYQESLLTKAGFDEWKVYFDTTELPDGPVWIFAVYEDEAGNRSYQRIDAQNQNNPPSVTGISIGGIALSSPWKAKVSGNSIPVIITASDSGTNASIASSGWKLEVLEKHDAVSGTGDVGDKVLGFTGWFYGSGSGAKDTFDPAGSGVPPQSGTVLIDTTGAGNDGFEEGYWYLLRGTAADVDENIAVRDFYIRVLNADETFPVVTIDDITQSKLVDGHIEEAYRYDIAAADIDATNDLFDGTYSGLADGYAVKFLALGSGTLPGGLVAGTTYYVVSKSGSSFQVSATSGGSAVDLTDSGTGTIRMFKVGALSGTIRLTGTAWDDVSNLSAAGAIKVQISNDGTTWGDLGDATRGSALSGDAVLGYTYAWSLEWNTEDTNGGQYAIARTGLRIRAVCADGTNTTTNQADHSLDVVPYIERIDTILSNADAINPSVYNRSALGWYPVRSNETITLTGYNFNGSSTAATLNGIPQTVSGSGSTTIDVTLGAYSVTASTTDHTFQTAADHNLVANAKVVFNAGTMPTGMTANTTYYVVGGATLTSRKFQVSATAGDSALLFTSNGASVTVIPGSGDLVVETNGYASLNNVNDNGLSQNQEANSVNNNSLTDDRRLKVWQMTSVSGTGDARNLDMEVSPTNGSVNFGAGYTDTDYAVFLGVTGSTATASSLRDSYTRYFDNKIAFNTSGTVFSVSQCGDTYLVPVSSWSYPSHFGIGRSTFASVNEYNNSTRSGLIYLESNWNGADLNNLTRVQWPDMKVSGANALSKIYLTYYDSTQKLIKFRYAEAGTSGFTSGLTTASNLPSSYSSTLLPYRSAATAAGSLQYASTEQAVSIYTTGGTWNQGYVAIAGANANSPYSAVGFTSTGTAVVAWYDAVHGDLKLKYNTAPATSFSPYQAFTNRPGVSGTYTFKLSIDGTTVNGGNDLSVTVPAISNGDLKHQLAYYLNLVLSNGYGAYAEVDPVTSYVTVRSMETGTGKTIALLAPSAGSSLITAMGGVQTAVNGTGEAWVERTIDADAAGKNVSLAIDSDNGVHLSYQNTSFGDLRYAYVASASGAPSGSISVNKVDTYLQVGQYSDITTVIEDADGDGDTEIVPCISYFNMANADTTYSLRFAQLKTDSINTIASGDTTTTSLSDGASSDKFTGSWEVMTVPALLSPKQYRISVGATSAYGIFMGYQVDDTISPIEYARLW